MRDHTEPIDIADQWLMDHYRFWGPVGFFISLEVDMTASAALIRRMRDDGFHGTYTHLFTRAAALALQRHADLHFMVAKTKRIRPAHIRLAVPVASDRFMAAAVLIDDAGNKPLRVLAAELDREVQRFREAPASPDEKVLKRWGRFPPRWLRKRIIDSAWDNLRLRLKRLGSLTVSSLNQCDLFVPIIFPGTVLVGTGNVRDRVVAEDGRAVVRPTTTISCVADHKAWNGSQAQRFLTEMAKILKDGELDAEWLGIGAGP